MKKLITTLFTVSCASLPLFSQVNVQIENDQANSGPIIVINQPGANEAALPAEGTAKPADEWDHLPKLSGSQLEGHLTLMDLPDDGRLNSVDHDRMKHILDSLRVGVALSKEGLAIELPDAPRPIVYTRKAIERALENSVKKDFGGKIRHFRDQARAIITASGKNETEMASRITLNRATDLVMTLLRLTKTPGGHRQFLANLYAQSFREALGQLNSDFRVLNVQNIDQYKVARLQTGTYGSRFALFLKDYISQFAITETARAVILLKALGYLAWDLHVDERSGGGTRTEAMGLILSDIYNLQKNNDDVKSILAAIKHDVEPSRQAVNRVVSEFDKIIRDVPTALKDAQEEMDKRYPKANRGKL